MLTFQVNNKSLQTPPMSLISTPSIGMVLNIMKQRGDGISRSGLSRCENFGYEHTRPTRHPGRVVPEEEEEENEEEEAKGSDEVYEESDSSLQATIEQMQIHKPNTRMPCRISRTHSCAKNL